MNQANINSVNRHGEINSVFSKPWSNISSILDQSAENGYRWDRIWVDICDQLTEAEYVFFFFSFFWVLKEKLVNQQILLTGMTCTDFIVDYVLAFYLPMDILYCSKIIQHNNLCELNETTSGNIGCLPGK